VCVIDSNQTRYQLLLGHDDWEKCTTDSGTHIFTGAGDTPSLFSWDAAQSETTLGVRINLFHSASGNVTPTISQRRGAGQDCFGNFYWIADNQTEILATSSGTRVTTHFWSSADEMPRGCGRGEFGVCQTQTPPAPLVFSGLAVTTEHYLVAGVVEPKGLVIFDLFHGGPPRRVVWPEQIAFAPFDMAPAPDGGVWILDRDHHALWRLDRHFAVIPQGEEQSIVTETPNIFSPLDGEPPFTCPPRSFLRGLELETASPLQVMDAVAVEGLPDGSVLLLQSNPLERFSSIYRIRNGHQIGQPVSLAGLLDLLELKDRDRFSLLGFDFAFISKEQTLGAPREKTLYVVGQNGDQSWAFTADYSSDQLVLSPVAEYYPMRLFGGHAVIAGPTQVYYDSQNRWVPLIIQRRPRYVEVGSLFTQEFDGKQPDCVWHKLMLDASIPPDTQITIYSRAHNDLGLLRVQPWTEEPQPYRRRNGTELPWTPMPKGLDTWELLFQRATGQYLQLKITLAGDGKLTPRIRALRAYFPRFSYLEHYLPGVYREDERSASFLDRFLANFEGFFTSIEDRIATVQALLDVGSAPQDSLDWLANWFGVALDPTWNEAKRRLFLHNAVTFFEARGTVPGLMMALRLMFEDCADNSIFAPQRNQPTGVRIVESFRQRVLPSGVLQDASSETGLPIKTQTATWTPALGASELTQRYNNSLQTSGTPYPIYLPASDPQFSQWSAFSRANLGLVPGRPDATSSLWATFLRTRYGSLGALSTAYRSSYAAFADVPFPQELPQQSQPLWDWYQFQGVLLIQAAAHQFKVFLPMPLGDAQNVITHRSRLNLAQRVIELEKPAHTTYEIKFYWAFFRVGEARLGEDSVLDYGSRAPQLLQPALLGDTYVGSVYLTQQPPGRPFLKQGNC
jgi:phage tail-like protein